MKTLRLTLILIVVFIAGTLFLAWFVADELESYVYEKAHDDMLIRAYAIAGNINAERFAEICWDDPNRYYFELYDYLANNSRGVMYEASQADYSVYNYTNYWLYYFKDGAAYTGLCGEIPTGTLVEQSQSAIAELLFTGLPVRNDVEDLEYGGFWYCVLFPITTQDGVVVGFLEASMPAEAVDGSVNMWIRRSAIFIIVTLMLMLTVIIVALWISSRTAKKLETAEHTITDVTVMRDSYSRFVPCEMFGLMGKNSVLETNPGDGANITAVLFELRIHGEYSGGDFFGFLNEFFGRVTPHISQNGGIIERHADNGLTAIFSGWESALGAAVSITGKCTTVISSEPVSIGIIGFERRISVGIVSRHILKKLGAAGEKMGCRVLCTDDCRSAPNARLLGYAGGRAVYDIFERDEPELKQGKLDTIEDFERSVGLYYKSDFYDARNGFIDVIKRSPLDLAAREYLLMSDSLYLSGANEFTPLLGV